MLRWKERLEANHHECRGSANPGDVHRLCRVSDGAEENELGLLHRGVLLYSS